MKFFPVIFLTLFISLVLSAKKGNGKTNKKISFGSLISGGRKQARSGFSNFFAKNDGIPIKIGGIFPSNPFTTTLYRYTTFQKQLGHLDNFPELSKYYNMKEVTRFMNDEFFPMDVLDVLCQTMIKEKVTAIIYMTPYLEYGRSTASSQYLLHMASYTGIPIIAWNADNSGILVNRNLSEYRLLQIAPPIQHQIEAMLAILKRYNWHKIAVVTSTIAGSKNFVYLWNQKASKSHQESFKFEVIKSVELDVGNTTAVKEKLSFMAVTEARIFILYSANDEADTIFKFAREVGLVRKNYLWIVTHSVIGSTWQTGKIGWPRKNFQSGMLGIYFSTDNRRKSPNAVVPQIRNAVKIVATALNKIVELYNTSVDFNSSASCTEHNNYTWETGKLIYKYLRSVEIDSAETGNLDSDPEFKLTFTEEGKLNHSYLSILNLRSDTREWEQDGAWNGLVRELVDQKADMCATSLKINSDRAKDIDFSIPYLETGIAIIVRIKRGGLSPTAFLEPFEYKTWALILVVCIHGAALFIFLFEWMSPQSFNMGKTPPQGHKFSLFRSIWLVWATLFSASVNTDVPRSHTARFMALVWAAFSLTFLAVYTANLAAFMITRTDHYDLTGIDDPMITNARYANPPFKYGTVKDGNTHQILKRTKKKLLKFIEQGDPGSEDDKKGYFRNPVDKGVEAVKKDDREKELERELNSAKKKISELCQQSEAEACDGKKEECGNIRRRMMHGHYYDPVNTEEPTTREESTL